MNNKIRDKELKHTAGNERFHASGGVCPPELLCPLPQAAKTMWRPLTAVCLACRYADCAHQTVSGNACATEPYSEHQEKKIDKLEIT